MKNWFERFFSIDEVRVSALIICLIAVIAACLVSVFYLGDINDNLLALSEALVYTVGGVTAFNGFKNLVSRNNSNSSDSSYSNDGINEYDDQSGTPKI